MTEIGIASIYKRDREDLRQWTQEDLVREAWLLKRKIACRKGEQIVDDYETGAEWEAALERRQTALTPRDAVVPRMPGICVVTSRTGHPGRF